MRTFWVLSLAVGLAGFPGIGMCDQTNPRLEPLFKNLQAEKQPDAASSIEQQIWAIWLEVSDPAVQSLLQEGIDAMGRGAHRSALEAIDQVVTLAPEFAEGWNKRATVQYFIGNYQESLSDIEATLELEPRHFGALSGRGLVYVELGDYQEALSAFEEALEISPQSAGPRANAEAIRKKLGQRDI